MVGQAIHIMHHQSYIGFGGYYERFLYIPAWTYGVAHETPSSFMARLYGTPDVYLQHFYPSSICRLSPEEL